MKNLELMEANTTEFQTLTTEQQQARREMLSGVLHALTEHSLAGGISERESGILTAAVLEVYLTGKLDRQNPTEIKRRKK